MKKLFLILLLISRCVSAQTTLKGSDTVTGTVVVGANVVSVQTTLLPSGTVGMPYSQALSASGGTPPYVWTLASGTLPPSVSLAGTGVIAGTPSAAGTFTFAVVATDQNGVASNPALLSIFISSGVTLTINNTSFPGFPFGQTYGQPINVTGGSGTGYACSLQSGSLPAGVTVSTNCTIGLTATSVGGSIGASFTFSLHVVDSLSNTFNSGNFTTKVIQPCGPPNYGCAGRAVLNDNCVIQIFGGGSNSPVGCAPAATSIPDLHNGFTTCTQGTNCSATDPQYNNILMTRCTDGTLNGTITSGTFLNRTYSVGQGSSGDTNAFTTDSSMMAVLDTGNRAFIESIDTTAHTCYPILSSGAPWRPGGGEFGSTTKGNYYSFFNNGAYTVLLYQITCTTPGHSGTPCTAPGSSTVVADFSKVFPGVNAAPWAASTSYNYGDYVTFYLTNSQSSSITAATCSSGTATYTLSPGLTALGVGELFNASGLSTFNGTAFTIATVNGPGTIVTAVTGCSTGSATGPGTFTEGANVLFQNLTAGAHSSGSSTPSWNTGALLNTTDSGITWMNSGTTVFTQGGGWTSTGGVSVDETKISAGMSNNNFDTLAKGALNISMNGNQNTGFLVYSYDSGAHLYYEWNTGSGVVKSFACTAAGTGAQCTRGSAGVTVVGQINVTSTTPCGSTPCQFYLHNVKIFKGGAWNEITPEFCTSQASGPGNCPAVAKVFWQTGTTTVNMAATTNAGHETERFTTAANFANSGTSTGIARAVTASNTIAPFWTRPNLSIFDGHWGWYYLNGSTNDSTTTPIGGTTDNTYDFPYTSPFESEVLIIPTCGVTNPPNPLTTPVCSGTELQNSVVAREGHTYATGANNTFNTQFAIPAYSQDGTIIAVSTDYACQFGQTDGGTGLCGFPWTASYPYCTGSVTCLIQPTSGSDFKATNAGGFVYLASGACTSGTVQPKPFNQTVGGTTTDGTCTWTNQGVGKGRGDVLLFWAQ